MKAAAASLARIAAIVRRELRATARGRTVFVLRSIYASLVVAAVVFPTLSFTGFTRGQWSASLMVRIANQGYQFVVWLQAVSAASLGAFLGVMAMVSERRNRTLGLLVLSQLKAMEVVLGKFLALVGLMGVVLLASVPVLALIGWAGGVEYIWLWRFGLLTVVFAAFGLSAGLAFGLRLRNGLGATVMALLFLSLPLLRSVWLASNRPGDLAGDWLAAPPMGVLMVVTQDAHSASFSQPLLVTLALVLLMLVLAARSLPKAAEGGSGQGLRGVFEALDRFFDRINFGGVRLSGVYQVVEEVHPRVRRPPGARPVVGNPVNWLGRTAGGMGLFHYDFRVAAGVLMATLLALSLSLLGALWIALTLGAAVVAAVLLSTWAGATSLGDEKGKISLRVLLASPLSAHTILRGKVLGYLRVFVLLFSLPALTVVVFTWAFAADSLVAVACWVAIVQAEAVCIYCVALNLSLHLASSLRAALGALAIVVAGHIALPVSFGIVFLSTSQRASPWWWAFLTAILIWLTAWLIVGLLAWQRRRPGLGLGALVAFLIPAMGVVGGIAEGGSPWLWRLLEPGLEGLSLPVLSTLITLIPLLLVASVLYHYALATFDLTLGRS